MPDHRITRRDRFGNKEFLAVAGEDVYRREVIRPRPASDLDGRGEREVGGAIRLEERQGSHGRRVARQRGNDERTGGRMEVLHVREGKAGRPGNRLRDVDDSRRQMNIGERLVDLVLREVLIAAAADAQGSPREPLVE